MYINFQQNRATRSVITVHTNVFAKKIASCMNLQLPIYFFLKIDTFRHASSLNVHVYQFSAKSG